MEVGPQNHNGDGLLGPEFHKGIYMDPLCQCERFVEQRVRIIAATLSTPAAGPLTSILLCLVVRVAQPATNTLNPKNLMP